MKRVIALVLALVTIFSLVACSSDESKRNDEDNRNGKSAGTLTDSGEKASEEEIQTPEIDISTIRIGSYINFGTYEQDNNVENGKEAVEWLVLDVKDGKALLLSKYALDCKQYHSKDVDVTWENCTIREWLNDDFFKEAFSTGERAIIPTVTVPADNNPYYDTDPGNATQDQVFLLSFVEATNYFSSDEERMCKPTDYAIENGVDTSKYNGNCRWWLRTPGKNKKLATGVVNFGDPNEYGDPVINRSLGAVRPALWIDLSKIK